MNRTREAIAKVVSKENLTEAEMIEVMREIMSGDANAAQISAFITALRMKGETIDEIVGAVRVMRDKATRIDTGIDTNQDVLVDIVGTGGDCSGSFNVSTTTSFVVAAAGVPVAKHGNRAVSSRCGSADVLEALGVDLRMLPEKVGRCVREVGIAFLFAPLLHGAMKFSIAPRRDIGIRTLFNILGPMTNPAGANVQLTGVFSRDLTTTMASVLVRLGMRRILVVWGEGGLDEITVTGRTHIAEGRDGKVCDYVIQPEDVGLRSADFSTILGGRNTAESAAQVRAVLAGEPGPKRDMVLLNAGATLMAADRAEDIRDGIAMAASLIDSGAAMARLEHLVRFSAG